MTPVVEILRTETGSGGTIGVLRVQKHTLGFTMEPPKYGNMPNVSCIPTGQYLCFSVESPTYGNTFKVRGVPGRDNILFHPGNTAGDTEGCILPGARVSWLDNARAVLDSRRTFGRFMNMVDGNGLFHLTITEVF